MLCLKNVHLSRETTVVPLRDENPIRITPYVTYGLIALNLLIFLYEISLAPPQLESFFRTWGLLPIELTADLRGDPQFAGLGVCKFCISGGKNARMGRYWVFNKRFLGARNALHAKSILRLFCSPR